MRSIRSSAGRVTLDNIGSAPLASGRPAVSSLVNCTAVLGTPPSTTVVAGGRTTCVVLVTPLAAGGWSCAISGSSNDSDEKPLNWTLSGQAVADLSPEVWVSRDDEAIDLTDLVDESAAATALT